MPSVNIDNYISITDTVTAATNGQGSLSGNFLTNKYNIIPNGTSKIYYNAADVGTDFTISSNEYTAATIYFASYINSRKQPDFMVISCAAQGVATGASLRTAPITPAQLSALIALGSTGTFSIQINGVANNITPNFTGATTLANIATILQTALRTSSTVAGLTVTTNTDNSLTIAGNQAGAAYTIGYGTDTSITPLINASLLTGANAVQGLNSATVGQLMSSIYSVGRNWVGITPVFDVSGDVGFASYVAILQFIAQYSNKFMLVASVPTVSLAQSLQTLCTTNNYVNCTVLVGDYTHASGLLSLGASTDYTALNGRLNYAYKSFSTLVPTVNNDNDWNTCVNAGISFYGQNSGRNAQVLYNFFFPCLMTGPYINMSNLYNQVWLDDAFSTNLIELLTTANNIPNDPTGVAMVTSSLRDVITDARTNGVIQSGNTFSSNVTLELIQAAGLDITPALNSKGYYLQILPATPTQRASGVFGTINFWFSNGQGVLFINMTDNLVV